MKRRNFLKVIAKGSTGLALALIGCKTEPDKEPQPEVEIGVDPAINGGDLMGGYLVPLEHQYRILAAMKEKSSIGREGTFPERHLKFGIEPSPKGMWYSRIEK